MAFSFITPYNFIPLGKPAHDKKLPWQKEEGGDDRERTGRLTGRIDYTLTTLTPLFIPNTSNDRVFSGSDADLEGSTEERPVYHKSFEFFSYTNFEGQRDLDKAAGTPGYIPVIPGTEIRGAVRSAYEALTDSCLSAIDLGAVLSKRTPEYFTPGILEWDSDGKGWILYCITNKTDYLYRENNRDDFSVKTFQNLRIQDGVEVTFEKEPVHAPNCGTRASGAKPLAYEVKVRQPSAKIPRGRLSGYLVKGEKGPDLPKPKYPKCNECPEKTKARCHRENGEHCYLAEKHCAHIFVKPRRAYRLFDQDQVEIYAGQIDRILRIYRENGEKGHTQYGEYSKTWREFMDFESEHHRDAIPVYFSEIDGGQFFFSPACVTREVYLKTLKDIIGNYAPCDKTTKCVCPACSLFGMLQKGKRINSRLRFSDLHIDPSLSQDTAPEIFRQVVTLPELSTPRITSTEFYLQKPTGENILNWTYDYYIKINGANTYLTAYTPVISGRKFYWHSNSADKVVFSQQGKIEVNARNKTVRPVADHVSFHGTVYFDGVSKKELQEIIAILNMSSFGEEDRYAIKLGSAKPLGFGSAALKIDSVKVRKITRKEHGICYSPDEPYDFGPYDLSIFERDEILKVFDTRELQKLEGHGAVVTYPKKRPEDKGYDWFTSNRFEGEVIKKEQKSVNLRSQVNGARYRWQVAYRQYMKPLQPELAQNDVFNSRRGQGQAENETYRQNAGPLQAEPAQKDVYDNRRGQGQAEDGTMEGVVSGHRTNKKGQYMLASLEVNGRQMKMHISKFKPRIFGDIREKVPVGTRVKIRSLGKNAEGYDDWECVIIRPQNV